MKANAEALSLAPAAPELSGADICSEFKLAAESYIPPSQKLATFDPNDQPWLAFRYTCLPEVFSEKMAPTHRLLHVSHVALGDMSPLAVQEI